MIWIIFIITVLMLFGPFRRWFMSSWRTVIPLICGMIFGFILSAMFALLGGPLWLIFFGTIAGALMIGAEGRKWFYDNFPPEAK